MSKNENCQTRVIEDSPSEKDLLAFNGDVGPHERVAKVISEIILSKDEIGGKMIGLEGVWGSGKSTVTNLLRKEIDGIPDASLFYFDAWAHEGDPFRRTYLESLIRHFQSEKWIAQKKWDDKLGSLAHRRKITNTRTIPHTTTLGRLFAFSLLLVPIGSTFLITALRNGITIDINLPISIQFILGLSLSSAPFLVLFGNLVRTWFQKGNSNDNDDQISNWSFLTGNAVTEVKQDTTETPEPTSIEFEDCFRELMDEVLPETSNKRAIIVLDNLDRVDTKYALSMWSTLQTFLQDRGAKKEGWYKKLWILIPYDPSGLSQLWSSQESPNKTVVDSFIDKSFQLRFEVPSLVLSNWKSYLIKLIKEALPEHAQDTEEQNQVYRVYSLGRIDVEQSPTPRELKLFVNQIGSIHRQWKHEFPLSHIAYYVLLKRQHKEIRTDLREGRLPDPKIEAILEPNLKENLAGLLFNVKAVYGQQLLLRDPIINALSKNQDKELGEFKNNHGEGFWATLEDIVASNLSEFGISSLSNAALCLNKSKILDRDRSEAISMINGLKKAALKLDKWTPMDNLIIQGANALLILISEKGFSIEILNKVRFAIKNIERKEDFQSKIQELLTPLVVLCKTIKDLKHDEALESPFVLPIQQSEWISFCSALLKEDSELWKLFKPSDSLEKISELLGEIVTDGKFTEAHLDVIKISQETFVQGSHWEELASTIEGRLAADEDSTSPEIGELIKCLYLLKSFKCEAADNALSSLTEEGHLMHSLHTIIGQDKGKGHIDGNSAQCDHFISRQTDHLKLFHNLA